MAGAFPCNVNSTFVAFALKVLFEVLKKIHFKYKVIQIQVFKLLFFMWTIYLVGKKLRIFETKLTIWKPNGLSNPPPLQNFLGLWPPPTPSEFPVPSIVGIWIFSGTTHYAPMTPGGHYYVCVCGRNKILWHHQVANDEKQCLSFLCFLWWNFWNFVYLITKMSTLQYQFWQNFIHREFSCLITNTCRKVYDFHESSG